MKLWTWWARFRQEHADDPQRRRLVSTYSDAFAVRESQPARAVALLAEAAELAVRLDEPWWRLLYEKFHLDALMHFQRDFREVLQPALQIVQEIEKPEFAGFPEPYLIADTLLAAYLGIDAAGYPETIRDLLTRWESEVAEEPSTPRYLLLARRRDFACEQERWQDALEINHQELDLAAHDPDAERAMHFALFAHLASARLAHQRGDDMAFVESAERAQELAQRCRHLCEEAGAEAWLALARRRGRREEEARNAYERAVAGIQHLGIPPAPAYFTALAGYHQEVGDFEAALEIRSQELKAVRDRNRRLQECRVRMERCRLLVKLGRPVETELEEARNAAAQLRCPDTFVEQLEELQLK